MAAGALVVAMICLDMGDSVGLDWVILQGEWKVGGQASA